MTEITIRGAAIDVEEDGEKYAIVVFHSGEVVVFDYGMDNQSWKVHVIMDPRRET